MRDGDAVRHAVHALVIEHLQADSIPFLLVDGDVSQRVRQVANYLSAGT
jgi:hypothetical protein